MGRLREFAGAVLVVALLCVLGGLLVLAYEVVQPLDAPGSSLASSVSPPGSRPEGASARDGAGPVIVDAEPPASREVAVPPEPFAPLTAEPHVVPLDQLAAEVEAARVNGEPPLTRHATADELAAESDPWLASSVSPPGSRPEGAKDQAADLPAPPWPAVDATPKRKPRPAAAPAAQNAQGSPSAAAAPAPAPKAAPPASGPPRGATRHNPRDLVLSGLGGTPAGGD